jgi:hypothetical protein
MVGDTLEDRVKRAEENVNRLRTSLHGMLESYDMLMEMPLPPTMVTVIRMVFLFEIAKVRETLKMCEEEHG